MNHGSLARLVAVGDIMLGDSAICVGYGFHSAYPRDLTPALRHVLDRLGRGEIVVGNLECLLSENGKGSSRLKTDQMRGNPAYARQLRQAGFTVFSVANNHAMQHGIDAFKETVQHLKAAGISCIGLRGEDGWCADPAVVVTRDGLRVGILGYCWRPRQYDESTPPYAEGDVDAVERDVRRLRAETDQVVVSLHWGEEFLGRPSVSEVEAAHRIIDAGAGLIIGHHPHVLRPVERYRNGLICYSLGNFVADMVWQEDLRAGGMLEWSIDRDTISQSSLSTLRINDFYAPVVESTSAIVANDPVIGVPDDEYAVETSRSVRRQQRAAYAYALRNVVRYRPAVLATMLASTARNKIAGIFSRSAPEASATRRSRLPAESGRLSILHFAAPAHFGGLESVLRELTVGSMRRGHQVAVGLVLSPGDTPHPLVSALEGAGVTVFPIYVGDRNYPGERAAVRKLCRQLRPDVVHTHGYRADVVDGAVARSEGIPVVSTCHGFIDSSWRARLHQWLQRRALKNFDAVVAVSDTIESRLVAAGVARSRIHVVRNVAGSGIEYLSREDARKALGVGNGQLIGWVGRLSEEKGPDIALEAFAILDRPTARLLFIGSGRNGAELRERATSLGIGDRVIWHGPVRDAATLFRAFDVFLISSRTEGTPMALLEAMAAGVPVVATSVGGIPAVVDESCACLVESEDVTGLATALSRTLTDSEDSRRRTDRATSRLQENFSVEEWLRAYDAVYINCVEVSSRNR